MCVHVHWTTGYVCARFPSAAHACWCLVDFWLAMAVQADLVMLEDLDVTLKGADATIERYMG